MHRKFEIAENFGCPKGVEKMNFSPKRLTIIKISEMKL